MLDADIKEFMVKTIFDEIIPTLDLPKEDLLNFAEAVIDRFQNPFIKHALLSITLNSISKWRARCMPSFLEYIDNYKKLPAHLTFSLAAMLQFYSGEELRDGALIGHRDGEEYKIMDDAKVLEFFAANKDSDVQTLTVRFLSNTDFWGQDLSAISGVTEAVEGYLSDIRDFGAREALKHNHLV
jgi:tagaturonate reductase